MSRDWDAKRHTDGRKGRHRDQATLMPAIGRLLGRRGFLGLGRRLHRREDVTPAGPAAIACPGAW